MSRRAKLIFIPAFVLACVNFFCFFFIAIYLGGDALNGYARDGHYFLCSHGRYTEVSGTVWTYSHWHAISVIVTHVSVFVLAAVFLNTGDMVFEKKSPMA
jgi:hypothetical protein